MSNVERTWTLEDLEAIVKKAVREALEQVRGEEVKLVAEALNKLATYTFEGFKKILEVLEKHSRILEEHSKILKKHSESLAKLEATLGSITSRIGVDMEKIVLNMHRDVLEREGLRVERVEKLRLKDVEGKYYRKGARLEIDIYAHNEKVYFIEVKSLVDIDDVEWFNTKCDIFENILGRKSDRRIIVCINILKDAYERARELGVHIVYGRVIEVEEEEEEVKIYT